jgi:hypothetical protein
MQPMIRRCLILLTLLLCSGCSSDGDKGSWSEFWKDLRGDNMQMRYSSPALSGMGGSLQPSN